MPRAVLIEFRRDTAANWTAANPVLDAGEPGWESDTNKLKIGDGATAWTSLAYFAGVSAGITVTDGTHTVNPATEIDFTSGATVSDAGGGVADVSVSASSGGLVVLYDRTLAVAAPTLDTGAGGIASGYKTLFILALVRSDKAARTDVAYLVFNNDTGANYDRAYLDSNLGSPTSGVALAGSGGVAIGIPAASATASYPAVWRFLLPAYDQTTFYKLGELTGGTVTQLTSPNWYQAAIETFAWRNTAAVTRIALAASSGNNLVAGSRLLIYGMQ